MLYTPRLRPLVPGGAVNGKGFQEIVPGDRYLCVPADDQLGGVGANIPLPLEGSVHDGQVGIGEGRVDDRFYLFLEPAGQGDVVGVDRDLVVRQLADEEQGVAGAGGRQQNPPVAGRGGDIAFFLAQLDERVFAGHAHFIGVYGAGHNHLPDSAKLLPDSPKRMLVYLNCTGDYNVG